MDNNKIPSQDNDINQFSDDIYDKISFDNSYPGESSSINHENQEINDLDHAMQQQYYWGDEGGRDATTINFEEETGRANQAFVVNPTNLGQSYEGGGGGSDSKGFNQPVSASYHLNSTNCHGEGSSSNQGESGKSNLSDEFTKTGQSQHEDVHTNQTKHESISLGLISTITPKDLNDIETTLARMVDKRGKMKAEKIKASNFQISLMRIGDFELKSMHEGHLVAKIYYAKRKLVWEYLHGVMKRKIEISFSDVVGIRGNLASSTLEVELNQPPSFGKEVDTQPGKHTKWEDSDDFTDGRASHFRIHYLELPPNTLDKNYEKLLQNDERLYKLSRSVFPTYLCTTFNTNVSHDSNFHIPNQFAPPRARNPGQNNFSTRVMNPGSVNNLQNNPAQQFDTMPDTRGLMMNPGISENNLLSDIAQHSTLDTGTVMNPGFGNTLQDIIAQHTMPGDNGRMMNPGLDSNVPNNIAQHSTLDTGWMMNPGFENTFQDINIARHITMPCDTTLNPGLDNNVPNNIAYHSTFHTREMMNPGFEDTLQDIIAQHMASRFNTRRMNPEIKMERQ